MQQQARDKRQKKRRLNSLQRTRNLDNPIFETVEGIVVGSTLILLVTLD